MRPVRLKLAGLHSFRETQEIDFEVLGEAGLFGIFGPTGSGKSSILDAMTLALYGQVERAARGTQGVLNHAEDRVLVEFTFELAHPEGRRRYRVERVYRRSGEHTVNAAGARLLEITPGGEIPLAEKSKVTVKVEEILGLEKDEFTRAVVLPQGKFADFLKLEPAKRRGMLQNLFGLHEYGDRLSQKIKGRLSRVGQQLAGVRGELEGLGDASDLALEQSLHRLDRAQGRVAEAAARRVMVEEQVKELEQVWTWQQELEEAQSALGALEGRQADINLYLECLDAANRAEKVKPYLMEVGEAEKNDELAQMDLLAAGDSLQRAVEKAGTARLELAAALERRQGEEPGLLEKKARLFQAGQLEKELSSLKEAGAELATQVDRQEKEHAGVVSDLEGRLRQKHSLDQAIATCRARLAEIQVAPERRRRVQAASMALQHYRKAVLERESAETAQRDKGAALALCQKAEEAAADAERAAGENLKAAGFLEKEIREHSPEDWEVIQNTFFQLEKTRAQVQKVTDCTLELQRLQGEAAAWQARLTSAREDSSTASEAMEEAARRLEKARQQTEAAERRLDSLQQLNQASNLARTLREGEACPVCGSRQHPELAPETGEEAVAAARDELRRSRETENSARDALESARRAGALLEAALTNSTEAERQSRAELEQKGADLVRLRSGLPAPWADLPVERLPGELVLAEKTLTRRQEAYQSWRNRLEEQQLELQRAQEAFTQASVSRAAGAGDLKAAAGACAEAGERLRAVLEEEHLQLDALRGAAGDLALEQIQEEQQRIEHRDHEKTALEDKRECLETELGEVTLEVEALSRRESLLAIDSSRAREKLDGLRTQYRQKTEELKAITGGKTARELLDEVEGRLNQLREAEEQAKKVFEEILGEKGQREQEAAAAERSCSLARQRLHAGCQKLSTALGKFHFASRLQAETALLPQEEMERMAMDVEEYRKEREKLSSRRLALVDKLDGRSLEGEAWAGWLESRSAAQKVHEDALQEQGAARTAYEKMVAGHTRWKELERQGGELGALKEQLEALEKLFRGNAFVEFLAGEQLGAVTRDASDRLGQLTRHRYALEVDSEGGFVLRDDGNGGVRRPVSTLSGGETFLTSLALALSLSAQIQLKGQFPLEFFFLDEGFGTLDPELLEVVVSTLEQLRLERLTIGVISHVPELKNRLPRRLVVLPAQLSGAGSQVCIESA